jgi:hypothetical protein
VSADNLRLLAARSEIGYTERLAEALPHEPEAVSADYQDAVTHRVTQTRSNHRRVSYQQWRTKTEAGIDELLRLGVVKKADMRLIRRELERVDRLASRRELL